MKFINAFGLTLAAVVSCHAAPTSYNEMQPSERALVDARNLICGQYPDRDWVLIGPLRVGCKGFDKRENKAIEVTVDKNWYVEYRSETK